MKRLFTTILAIPLLLSGCGDSENNDTWTKDKLYYKAQGISGYNVYDVDYYHSWEIDDKTKKWFVSIDNTKYVSVGDILNSGIDKLVYKDGKYTFYIYIQKVAS